MKLSVPNKHIHINNKAKKNHDEAVQGKQDSS